MEKQAENIRAKSAVKPDWATECETLPNKSKSYQSKAKPTQGNHKTNGQYKKMIEKF